MQQIKNYLGDSAEVTAGSQAGAESLSDIDVLSYTLLGDHNSEVRVSDLINANGNISGNTSGNISNSVLDWFKGLLDDQADESQQGVEEGDSQEGASQEGDSIAAGTVQKLLGTAAVTRDGEEIALLLGDDVFADDLVSTGAKSAIGIVFIDGMKFNLGSDAKLLIDEFVFDQSQSTGEQSLAAIKGAFSYESGLLGQEDPSAVTIKTALGTLGIRGTKLIGLSDYPEGTCVITLLDGEIEVMRDKGGDSIILDKPFETARMKIEWDYIDKSQLSQEEVLDTFSILFGGDEDALRDFMDDKSSSLETPTPYSLYETGTDDALIFSDAIN